MGDIIEIEVQPAKKIVIFECIEFPIEELFKRVELMVKSGRPMALNWAEGVLFLAMPYQPDSDVMIQQTLKGTMYLGSVIFSAMPEYQSIRKMGAWEVPIIDQTLSSHIRQVAKWLKKRMKR